MRNKFQWINFALILFFLSQLCFYALRQSVIQAQPDEPAKATTSIIVPSLTTNDLSTEHDSGRLAIQDRCFRTVISEAPKKIDPPTAVQQKPQTPQGHYYFLGKMTDEKGITKIFIKQKETGRILQVREDGTAENGISYRVKQDGVRCVTINGVDSILQGAFN